MKERIAIIDGLRSPMGKMGGKLKSYKADDLGAYVVRELLARHGDLKDKIDEVIIGNVAQPAHAANIARVIALKAGIDKKVPAFTVHRNCASGMEAITSAANKILAGDGEIYLAGGAESMSDIPLLYSKKMQNFFEEMMRARSFIAKLKVLSKFRLSFLKPIIGLKLGLTDPYCGMIMGDTAEVLAKEFGISRDQQDRFAMQSHNKAERATANGIFAQEIIPMVFDRQKGLVLEHDEGIRPGQNMKDLGKLKPFFDRHNGTVTAGNSSQITDGAAAVILMSETKAKALKLKPIGYLKAFAYAGLDPHRMGLGPVFASHKALQKAKMKLSDMDLIEINEAFATQVIACTKAFASKKFAKEELGSNEAMGEIDPAILNVNGGAVALGHPVGMTGTRLVIHVLKELKRRKKQTGLASLCIGGGQGAALILEVE
jgi:acetyl-CoA acetyltransferase family protein